MDAQSAIKYYDNKFNRAKEIRQSYEPVWDNIIKYISPDIGGYLNIDKKSSASEGDREDYLIYDNTPTLALQQCAAGMFASISSPSRPWMQRRMSDDDYNQIQGVRTWLDAVTAKDYSIFHRSNFYRCAYTVYYHLAAIGTAVILCEPDYEHITHWTALNVGEYWLMLNGKGLVDTLFRELTYTAEQLKGLFGESSLPDDVARSITKDNPVGTKDIKVRHVIEPDSQGMAPFRKPWSSVYYLVDKRGNPKQVLEAKGYNRKPFAAPRWYANNNETYGKMYPGRNSLGNCQQFSSMVYDYMDACDKELNPATQGPAVSGGLDIRPGHHNILDPSGPDPTIKRLFESHPQLQYMWASITDKREQIQKDFYNDLFMSVSMRIDKQMTASEVRAISSERMMALGPVLENVHTEFLNEITDIEYEYATQARAYPPIQNYVQQGDWQRIQGQEIKTDYVSILAQAQKAVDVSRFDTLLSYIGAMAQFQPSIVDKVDFDQMIDDVSDQLGAPANTIRSDDDTAKIRQQREQQLQSQQMLQGAQQVAGIAKDASNMPMNQDTAFTRMLGVTQ